jgi:hypothetical protein
MVAVAVPAAFATSQAAARSATTPLTTAAVTPSDTEPAECAALMEAPVEGASCEMTSKEDLSGKHVVQLDSLSDRLYLVIIECIDVGGGWWACTSWWFEIDVQRVQSEQAHMLGRCATSRSATCVR